MHYGVRDFLCDLHGYGEDADNCRECGRFECACEDDSLTDGAEDNGINEALAPDRRAA